MFLFWFALFAKKKVQIVTVKWKARGGKRERNFHHCCRMICRVWDGWPAQSPLPYFFNSATSLNINSANYQHLKSVKCLGKEHQDGDDGSGTTQQPWHGFQEVPGTLWPIRADPERAWQDLIRHPRPDIQVDAGRLRKPDERSQQQVGHSWNLP